MATSNPHEDPLGALLGEVKTAADLKVLEEWHKEETAAGEQAAHAAKLEQAGVEVPTADADADAIARWIDRARKDRTLAAGSEYIDPAGTGTLMTRQQLADLEASGQSNTRSRPASGGRVSS